ncbi:telomere repeats-binding bouquet formation protein 1-like [Montipora capricornis]|uniref:telomere repeats-binding bouquet formation protein 1-like n=1 Tax=Montipora capricornis TaxID=246305 RepID=UPI0035F18A5A
MNAGTCKYSELEKEVQDVKLLQESLRLQEGDFSQQIQALRALSEILSQNRRAQDYFCSTHGLEYVFSLSKTVKESDLSQAALRTLAMATEGNDISQRALTKASVFHMLRSNLNAKKSTITTASSAFLLLTICADNVEGQNLARETKCLQSLCDLFKSSLPIHKDPPFIVNTEQWFSNVEEGCIQLWKAVVVALQSLLQNPQNAENQLICCRLLPSIVNLLHLATKQQNIIIPTNALLGAIVSGNSECQSKVRLLGGLRALITVLKEFVRDKQPSDEILYFVEHVVNTIGSSTAGHGMCQETTADLGLVSLLVKCLDMSSCPGLSSAATRQFRTKCVLTLSICVDHCERNQQQLLQRGGVKLLIELLTQEQSEEFRRITIFVLHCITRNNQDDGKMAVTDCSNQDDISNERMEISFLTREAETQTEDSADRSTQGACIAQSGDRLTKVISPLRDAETQTDHVMAELVSAEQSNGCPEISKMPRRQESQQTQKMIMQQKKRCVSVKVLKPLTVPRNSSHSMIESFELKDVKRNNSMTTMPNTSAEGDQVHCVVCVSNLNSRNFLPTLKSCETPCFYHQELKRKLNDLRRRNKQGKEQR